MPEHHLFCPSPPRGPEVHGGAPSIARHRDRAVRAEQTSMDCGRWRITMGGVHGRALLKTGLR
eukprot:5897265-Alexandrium_andersonii.AAC.1